MPEPTITIRDPAYPERRIEELANFTWFLDDADLVMLKMPSEELTFCNARQLLHMHDEPWTYPLGTMVRPITLTSANFERTQ
jgi:hypothetical protein